MKIVHDLLMIAMEMMKMEHHRLFELAEEFDEMVAQFQAKHDLSDKDMAEGMVGWIDYKMNAEGELWFSWTEKLGEYNG